MYQINQAQYNIPVNDQPVSTHRMQNNMGAEQNTISTLSESKSIEFRYTLAARVDTYGLVWKAIGILQMVLMAVSLILFLLITLPPKYEENRNSWSNNDVVIYDVFNMVIPTLMVACIGFSNFITGKKIIQDSEIAIHNPTDLLEKVFRLKEMTRILVVNAFISGGIEVGVGDTTVTIGLLGVIGALFGFYVRYYIMKNIYLIKQDDNYDLNPAPMSQRRRR